MEKDTRRLALISVGLGIGIVSLMPVHAGLAHGFRPGLLRTFGPTLWGNLRATDALDIIQNILLYLPLGYFAAVPAALTVGGDGEKETSPGRRLLLACALGIFLSTVLEGCQMWIPGRYCSLADILTNALGAWLGGLAALSISLGDPV